MLKVYAKRDAGVVSRHGKSTPKPIPPTRRRAGRTSLPQPPRSRPFPCEPLHMFRSARNACSTWLPPVSHSRTLLHRRAPLSPG